MITMIGMPLMVDNTNCLSIFHIIFQLNTTAPHVYVYVHEGSDEHGPLIALVDIYAVYEGFNLNPSRLFNIRQHYLV